MGLVEAVKVLEAIARTPSYSVVGFTHGRLVYASTEEGVVGVWSLDVEKGIKRRLTRLPVHSVVKPDPRSKLVIYTRDLSSGKELQGIFAVSVEGGEEEAFVELEPMRFFGFAYDGDKLAFSAATEKEMALYMAERGSCEKILRLEGIAWPSDMEGNYVVGAGMLRGDPRTMELFIVDVSSGDMKVYTPREGSVNKQPMIRGGKLLFESNFEGKHKLYVYDIETEELVEAPASGGDYRRYDPVEHVVYGWTEDGKIWAVGKRDGRSKPFIDGREVPSPEGFVDNLVVVGDRAYYSASTLTSPPKIYEATWKGYRVIVDNNLPEEVRDRIGERKFVRYRSRDGLEIPMYVVESKAAPKPGPTVLYVHGGPWSEVADQWRVMIAGLAASGYHVLAPNFRGSTGYGEEFRVKDVGDPGGGDLEDVIAAREWGVKEGIASKVAIMGYSYGGYMTYLALGRHPELWDAGVAGAGIVDWIETYQLSDALFKKFIETLFAGYKEELLRERSPITYIERVKAPLCIVHPQNDTRTPLKPVLRYAGKLLEQGNTFEMHVIPDMGHVIVKTDDMIKVLLPAIIFLNTHLRES